MFERTEDTIVGIATPVGGAWRGIVRLSGPRAMVFASSFFSPQLDPIDPGQWRIFPGRFNGPDGVPVPGHCLVMAAPRSYTREDVVELHTLGAGPLLEHLCEGLIAAGARMAAPGEFTYRAFVNGRIDLCQAEAVASVIAATDEGTYRNAQHALAGDAGARVGDIRQHLFSLRASLEAELNWPEEEGIAFLSDDAVASVVHWTRQALADFLAQRETLSGEVRIVLAGPANAGKSTLFNALLGEDRALVHGTPGTTSDAVTASLLLGDVNCQLVDTAGMLEAAGVIHDHAVRIRDDAIQQADLVVGVVDLSDPDRDAACESLMGLDRLTLVAGTKTDKVAAAPEIDQPELDLPETVPLVPVCAVSGHGLSNLKAHLRTRVLGALGNGDGLVNARQAEAAARAHDALHAAMEVLDRRELCAMELKTAEDALAALVGDGTPGDLLDAIFSRFCIGK